MGVTALNALDVIEAHKRLGRHTILDRVSVAVRQATFFGLVGGNGAGKTTLIRCILDLCRLDHGEIRLFGVPAVQHTARCRVAYLPERFLPPAQLSGREFVACVLRLHGVTVTHHRIEETLYALDMEPSALSRPIRTLSKGMTQKLGLAGCLLSDKELLLLDEPTSGLDPLARALLKCQLLRRKEQGLTLFINTHILTDVENLCDAMAILHHGRLLFVGSPSSCREQFGGDSLEESYLNVVRGSHLQGAPHV
ncbi:MAG: ABC transporter ATP-binding protein [Magnetococcales bacterium]|nr:ABC transporter ATP-binding protein [Magnetococcales bacterium]